MKTLIFFITVSFLLSGFFACHIYTAEAADFTYDFSDSCLDEEEILASQNKAQNNQKFAIDFSSGVSEKSSSLIQQKDAFFVSSEDLDDSQTAQLLAVVKIE